MTRLAVVAAALALLMTCPHGAVAGGEALFIAECSACHQAGGIGTPGLAPPVASRELSRIVASGQGRAYLPQVVLDGLSGQISVGGQHFFSAMPPRPHLTDEQVAEIATYVASTLNGVRDTGAYSAAEVAALREKPATHDELRSLRKRLVQ